MFTPRLIQLDPVPPRRPLRMPLDILLALAPNQTPGVSEAYNVLAVCQTLLGHFGWERATRVLNPRVWAPDWDAVRFGSLLAEADLHPDLAPVLRVSTFPGLATEEEDAVVVDPGPHTPEIVHFVGEVFHEEADQTPFLKLNSGPDEVRLLPGALRDALVSASVRLLVLQVALTREKAVRLAEFVVGGGGPAVLVVSGGQAEDLRGYLLDLYGGIVHNQPLSLIAEPSNLQVDVTLVSRPEHEEGLLFTTYLQSLRGELGWLSEELERTASRLREQQVEQEPRLHRADLSHIDGRIAELEQRAQAAKEEIARLDELEGEIWTHESDGAIPLSEVAERAGAARAARDLYPALEAEMEAAVQSAPRVLNANFASPSGNGIVAPSSSLLAGREYDLLVDIGPRWNTVPSIVTGSAEFPEQALPPSESGTVLRLLLASSDFSPRTVTADLWLPYGSGRSHPIVEGEKAGEPGPVALRITAPAPPEGAESHRARARLCVYYQNNLLQSAIVDAGVSRNGGPLEEPSRVEVDYVMSGTFREVAEKYATRDVHFPTEGEGVRHPIALSLTLNDDGAGHHRIIVSGDEQLPAGWSAYDPSGASETLKRARRELLNCFLKRDRTGEPEPDLALDSRNGKDFEQFRRDLFVLARLGERLYSEVLIASWSEESGMKPRAWERELRRRLDRSRIIQIARTGSAQYTYPWGLMYEYPLPGTARDLHWCDVLRQWADDGTRGGAPEVRCPYADDENHQENILCPYGFWGLKHIIEQPLSVLDRETGKPRDVATEIPVDGQLGLAAGWTADSALDQGWMSSHRQQLLTLPGLAFCDPQPNPAFDVTGIRAVLASPSLVYFLCHGEYDPIKQEAYLGIGPRDQEPEHRIYPSTLVSLARSPVPPNLEGWASSRPLVFLNGCHTANLAPGDVLNFVSAFALAQASGVIGTEVSVRLTLATEVAEDLLGRLAAGERAGRALYDMRWKLANKGNLLGLAYTLYSMANLHVTRN